MIDEYIDVIENSPLFNNINKNELILLFNCLKPKIHDYNKDEFIINNGEKISKFGLVLKGEILITKENVKGDRVVMSILKKGDLFGEMFVFSSHKIWPLTVISQTNCKILFFSNSDLITRCNKNCSFHTTMLKNFIEVISNKGLMLNKKIEYLSLKSIRSKLCSYLLDEYKKFKSNTLNISLNRNELADFLNVSRPSLSREMSQMHKEGLIDYYLSTFKIKDIESLKKFL